MAYKFRKNGGVDYAATAFAKRKAEEEGASTGSDPFGHVRALQGLREGLSGRSAPTLAEPSWEGRVANPVRNGGVSGIGAPPVPQAGASVGTSGDLLTRLMGAIRTKESGGNYKARGLPTRYGTATGAYQFLDTTWGGYGGYKSAAQAPAEVQDARARQLMGQYLQQFGGDPAKVAVAWYAGPGRAKNYSSGSMTGGERAGGQAMPSIDAYAKAILKLLG